MPVRRPLIVVEIMRFVCALAVVGFHYLTGFRFGPSPDSARALTGVLPMPDGVAMMGRFGWLGVEIFFVVSGMMIATTVGDTANPIAFLRRRFLRLVPAAWICATLTLVAICLDHGFQEQLGWRWFRSVIFWPMREQIDPSYWTLGIEVMFYLVVSACLIRRGHSLIFLAMILTGASMIFWITWILGFPIDPGNRKIMLSLLPHGSLFSVGILLFNYIDRKNKIIFLFISIIPCLLEIYYHDYERSVGLLLEKNSIYPMIIFVFSILLILYSDRLQFPLSRIISPEKARDVGRATYPLYLVHQEAGAVVIGHLARGGIATGPAMAITAALACLAAWLIGRWVEPPLAALLRDKTAFLIRPVVRKAPLPPVS